MPILRRAGVTSGRRNARKGVDLVLWAQDLRYVLIPRETGLSVEGPTGRAHLGCALLYVSKVHWLWELEGSSSHKKCCDALRCSGPHARYTDRASEYITLAERSG